MMPLPSSQLGKQLNSLFLLVQRTRLFKKKYGLCTKDADCPVNETFPGGNGMMTGRCYVSELERTCEIRAWCPVQIDKPSERTRIGIENVTVLIKNNVVFPDFKESRFNIPADMDDMELDSCLYDPDHVRNKDCPVFSVGTILRLAGQEYEDIFQEGCVILMIIEWNCDFDKGGPCLPKYEFQRLDRSDHNQSRGFNMRYPDLYNETERNLYTASGIRVIVTIHGTGRKFDFYTSFLGFCAFYTITTLASYVVPAILGCRRYWMSKEVLEEFNRLTCKKIYPKDSCYRDRIEDTTDLALSQVEPVENRSDALETTPKTVETSGMEGNTNDGYDFSLTERNPLLQVVNPVYYKAQGRTSSLAEPGQEQRKTLTETHT